LPSSYPQSLSLTNSSLHTLPCYACGHASGQTDNWHPLEGLSICTKAPWFPYIAWAVEVFLGSAWITRNIMKTISSIPNRPPRRNWIASEHRRTSKPGTEETYSDMPWWNHQKRAAFRAFHFLNLTKTGLVISSYLPCELDNTLPFLTEVDR